MTDDSNLDSTAAAAVRGLWFDSGQHDHLLAALIVAASRTDDDLDCVACDEGTCTDPDHNEPTVKVRQWRGLAQKTRRAALRHQAGGGGLRPWRRPAVAH